MNFFRYNIVVAAYPVFVYVVSRAGRQVQARLRRGETMILFDRSIRTNEYRNRKKT